MIVRPRFKRLRRELKHLLVRQVYARRALFSPRLEALFLNWLNPRRRAFLSPGATVEAFFADLEKQCANYVVLRWFEDLPRLHSGQDLDLLVGDESLDAVFQLLSPWPIGHPVDVHSVQAPVRIDRPPWCGKHWTLPSPYPAHRAKEILSNKRLLRDLCRVPGKVDHFMSLAAHVSFVKSQDVLSHIASAGHDYPAELHRLSIAAGMPLPRKFGREDLRALLIRSGWTPESAVSHGDG